MGPLGPLFYIFLTTFLVSFAVCLCFLRAWCREQEEQFKKAALGLPNKFELDFIWTDKNVCSELETSVSSVQGTTTFLFQNNQLGIQPDSISNTSSSRFFYPLSCNMNKQRLHKSDSELEVDRMDYYQKPVDIIIHVEDFDEISRSDVSLKGSLALPVSDEPQGELFEMKPICKWKDLDEDEQIPFNLLEQRDEEILI